MPDIIIVAGPNGAGKTSFANAFLPEQRRRYRFINADEIERSLRVGQPASVRFQVRAGRLMLSQIDEAIERQDNIAIETTLATRIYAAKIEQWKQ
ncbi:MAG: zeta toxin family protein [Hyphomicrobiaceae bacterium]